MRDVDLLVVGAGPAGAVAAWAAREAAPELDVALLERDPKVGSPVRCAEGVGDAGLREFADPTGAPWAARKITRVIFLAPDDTEVTVAERDVGWVLDRTRFDAHLAAAAAAAGAEVLVDTEDTRVPARDMESCAQYVLQGIDFDPDAIYLQFGDRIAPGGYAWVFPKGVRVANVGLGLVALKADGRSASEYLDAWVARRYPAACRTGSTVG